MSAGGENRLYGVSSEEASQEPRELWQSAFAGTDFLGTKAFLVLLALRDDPTKIIYATLEIGGLGARIDIPLEEHTSEEELRRSINLHPTLWGGTDPDGYREATETFSRGRLLASLNRTTTGADTPNHVPARFYGMLHISHGEVYGAVHVGSHGGSTQRGYDFNATLEPMLGEFRNDSIRASEGVQIDQAMAFGQLVQASLPHLTVTPLPVDTYLQDVQATLQFLPRD